jgi:hypothetical protein
MVLNARSDPFDDPLSWTLKVVLIQRLPRGAEVKIVVGPQGIISQTIDDAETGMAS